MAAPGLAQGHPGADQLSFVAFDLENWSSRVKVNQVQVSSKNKAASIKEGHIGWRQKSRSVKTEGTVHVWLARG